MDYLLARIACGESRVPNTRLFLNSECFSTIEDYIISGSRLLGVRFLFWFYLLSYHNRKPKHQQEYIHYKEVDRFRSHQL
nr:MAG TPA: hypothetical protein [Caudoviricetes sp.]